MNLNESESKQNYLPLKSIFKCIYSQIFQEKRVIIALHLGYIGEKLCY